MLFAPKAGISQKTLNYIKRLAAFKNPEFYKAQAMRMRYRMGNLDRFEKRYTGMGRWFRCQSGMVYKSNRLWSKCHQLQQPVCYNCQQT